MPLSGLRRRRLPIPVVLAFPFPPREQLFAAVVRCYGGGGGTFVVPLRWY